MGSFNVGCGLSNLSIGEYDRVGFVLIGKPETYNSDRLRVPSTKTMHLYSTDLYLPYLPPVYGAYDDYGRLTDIEESVTTEVIEDLFRRPVKDVLNAVGDDRSLYSSYGKLGSLYIPDPLLTDFNSLEGTTEDKLALLGFSLESSTAGKSSDTVQNTYRFGQYSLVELHEPRYWRIDDQEAGTVGEMFYAHKAEQIASIFSFKTNTYPGVAREDWLAVRELQGLSGMFFLKEIYEGMVELVTNDRWRHSKHVAMEENFETLMSEDEHPMSFSNYKSDLQRDCRIRGEVWSYLLPMVGTGEFVKIAHLVDLMSTLNRLLMPSFNGEQFGNDGVSLQLATLVSKIAQARISDEDEY